MFKKLLLATVFVSPLLLANVANADPVTLGTAALSAGIAAASGTTILGLSVTWSAVAIFASSVAFSYLSKALTPKPKTASSTDMMQNRLHQFQQPISEREIIYGETRKSGPVGFLDVRIGRPEDSVDNTPSDQLHMVILLASHEIDGIEEIYLDDYPIFPDEIDEDGHVTVGKFAGRVRVTKYNGTADQEANPLILEAFPDYWTTNHRMRGIAYLHVMIANRMAYFSAVPKISAWVRGKKVVDIRESANPSNWSNNPALCILNYLTSSVNEMGLDFSLTNEIDEESFIAAANHADEFVTTQDFTHEVLGVNTSSGYLEVDGDICRFQTGDKVNVTSTEDIPDGLDGDLYVIVKRRVTRTESTPSKVQIQFASSYADALEGTSISINDEGSGDITVTKIAEPRYTCCGVIASGRRPYDNIGDLLSCISGRLTYVGGKWRLLTSLYNLTDITFNEDHIRQGTSIKVQTKHSRRDRFNSIRGIYSSPLHKHVATDYPPVTNSTYVTEDNENTIWKDLDLPFTTRPHTAQRLAKIELEKHRQQITVEMHTNLAALETKVGDVILLTSTRFGWADKEFEVVEWKLVSDEIDGAPFLGCDLLLRETDSSVYDWNSGEETAVDPAPNTQLPSPFDIDNPTNLTAASGDDYLDIRLDGTVFSRIYVSWTAPTSPYVYDGGSIEVQFKRASESVWRTHALVPGSDTSTYILDVKDGELYDIRVRSVNYIGTKATTWVTITNHLVIGKTAPPSDVSTFNIARLGDGTRRFTWTHANVPADVRVGGGYLIRYALGTGHEWDDLSALHTGVLINSPYETNELSAGTYTFGIKAIDSSGNESLNAILVEATLGDPRLRSVIYSQNEFDGEWPGSKTDCFVNLQNHLEATGAETWADLPATWDALADTWRGIVDNNSPIVYETEEIDLGLDISFTPLVTVDALGTVSIEMQTGSSADGSVIGSFSTLGVVEGKRYLKLRVTVTGTTPYIFGMIILLDAETQIEDYEDIDTSGPSDSPTEFESIATGHFKIATRGNTASITKATITAFQNAGSGWTWELISKATTITGDTEPAAEFKIYKDGVLTDAVVDVEIKGPKG